MKTNELMIGDYIYQHHPKDNTPHIVKVSIDTLDLMERMQIDFIKEHSPLYRIIEPILLTPEILEKNGFVEITKRIKKLIWLWKENGVLVEFLEATPNVYQLTIHHDSSDL